MVMDSDLSRLPLVHILADMPDLWMRTLREHSHDSHGYCFSCRDAGELAVWPCLPWEIARAAESLAAERTSGLLSGRARSPSEPPHRLR